MTASVDTVCRALDAATSQEPSTVKNAEQMLVQLRTFSGFHCILAELAADPSVAINVRWMAVLYLKNSVDSTLRCSLPAGERPLVRASLLKCYCDPAPQLAVQVAAVIGRLARQDCPAQWPELVPLLLEGVTAPASALLLQRSLQTLYQVVQALASRRLTAHRRVFHQLATAATPAVLTAWQNLALSLAASHPEHDQRLSLHSLRLCVKLLRRILAHGPRCPSEADTAVSAIAELVFARCHDALLYRQQLGQRGQSACQSIEELDKYIACLVKLLLDVLDHHPLSYVSVITRTLEFGSQLLFTEQGRQLLFDRLAQLWLTLLQQIVACEKFYPPNNTHSPCEELTKQAYSLMDGFLDGQSLEQLVRQMIIHYMVMTESELVVWREDPEAFFIADDRLSVSAAAECLFTALLRRYSPRVTPLLLAMLREQLARGDVLARDAVYCAVGMAAYDLYDHVDMDSWLCGGLLDELAGQKQGDTWKRCVLQRRVSWLIGRWLGVRVSCDQRPAIYAVLVPLLQPDHDLVVRLTVAETLKDAVDNFEFRPEDLSPLLPTLFPLLFRLLVDVVECETKMRVLNVVSFVVERLDEAIVPHCGELLTYLPQLWRDAAALGMLRVMIARTLEHLVCSLSGDISGLHGLLLEVIGRGVDLSDQVHVYLLEDALHLWRTVIENVKTLHPDFMQLYERLLPVMELGSDSLECGLAITQAYMLLDPTGFMVRYGAVLARVCTTFASVEERADVCIALLRTVETALRCGGPAAVSGLEALLPWPLAALLDEAAAPGRLRPAVSGLMFSVLARLLLLTPRRFEALLAAAAGERGLQSVDAVLSQLLDAWLVGMPLIGQIERKKLCALALCALLPSCADVVAARINVITLSVAETLHDVSLPDSLADSLVWQEDADGHDCTEFGSETAHDKRRRGLMSSDPTHTRSLREAVAASFRQLRSAVGQQRYMQLLAEIDVETSAAIETYVNLLQ